MELLGTKDSSGGVACCTFTSCEACPPLVQMVPAVLISIACNSHPKLQQFKGVPVTVSTSGSFGPGYRV